MEDKFDDIQHTLENCSVQHYQRMHELAKHGMGGNVIIEPDDEDEEDNEGLPISLFCDPDANRWWKEGIENSDVTVEHTVEFDEDTNKIGFWLRLRRDGKVMGKKRYMWADCMMDLMIIAGTLVFGKRLRDHKNCLWEIEIAESAQRLLEMFLYSLEEDDRDASMSVRSMMAYRSGFIRGRVADVSDVYAIYKCIDEGVSLDTAGDYDDEED